MSLMMDASLIRTSHFKVYDTRISFFLVLGFFLGGGGWGWGR